MLMSSKSGENMTRLRLRRRRSATHFALGLLAATLLAR